MLEPVCAAGQEEPSPDEDPARAPLIGSLSSLDGAATTLTATESSLRSFTATRILSTKGAKGGQSLFERIRSGKRSVLRAAFETRRARRESGASDVPRLVQQARETSAMAEQISAEVRVFVEEASNVDATAEAKERARIEAAEAERRKKEQAAEEARARVLAEQARREEAARKREADAAARKADEDARRAEADRIAEARRMEATRIAEARRMEATRIAEAAAAKKVADAEAKERARRDAELLAQQAEAAKQAELAKKASANEASQRAKLDKDFAEADARVRSDLDHCSQTIAMLTMVEMSSKGQTKVSDAKVALQNHKDKLRALLGRLAAAKAKIPLKAAVDEMAQANDESKALTKETAKLVAMAKSLKN